MRTRLSWLLAAVLPLLFVVGVAITAAGSGALDPVAACLPPGQAGSAPDGGGAGIAIGDLSAAQLGNAHIVYSVAIQRGLPARAGIIALGTALQESTLRNLTVAVDHDSLGLFQQRPSQGWGTPAQILDPVYASNAFYNRLVRVAGWQTMTLTQAAQAVQRSAFPNAYAKWEALATELANQIAPTVSSPDTTTTVSCSSIGTPSTEGWIKPVAASIGSGFRTGSRPGHDGVDLSAGRGTTILAAAAGTVTVVKCNITPATWGCNRDGNPSTPGCGWYVDITHANNVITRYCHMLTRPAVNIGQQVTAGQPIGIVGSSGHSSGPHLHFEVHLGDHGESSAVDPIAWMQQVGAPLGP